MNQTQLDGITKARLFGNIFLAGSGQPLINDDAAYVAKVTTDAGITALPDSAANSYAEQHAGRTIAVLELDLVKAVQKATDSGLYGGVAQPEEPPVSVAGVPVKVTMRQARLALFAIGKLATVDTILNSLPEPQRTAAKIEWEFSGTVERNRPLVLTLGPALGLDAAALDTLFITAAGL